MTGIPRCPDCHGPMHLDSSAYGRAWVCDRRAEVSGGCQGNVQLRGDDELTELQLAELISQQSLDNAPETSRKTHLSYREVINALETIAKKGYLSDQQRGVLQKALGIVERLADADELSKNPAGLQEKAADEAMEQRFQQAMGLLGPSFAPDPMRLEASVIDLLALALFGAEACSLGPEILTELSIETLDNDLQRRSSEGDSLLDALFADLVAMHQRLRESVARAWSARSETIEDLHGGFIEALPGLRERILTTPPAYLQRARCLIDEDTSDNVVPLAPRRTQ